MAEEGFWTGRWNHVVSEWRVIMQAKTVFGSAALLLIAGTALAVWRVMAALDAAEVSGLHATIQADEATIRYQDIQIKSLNQAISNNSLSRTNEKSAKADVKFSDLSSLSNDELRDEVMKLTKDLRSFEASYKNEEASVILSSPSRVFTTEQERKEAWDQMIRNQNELLGRENYKWQTEYRGRVRAVYEALCKKLGIMPISDNSLNVTSHINNSEAATVLRTGMLAGIYPTSALADYLESLARQL